MRPAARSRCWSTRARAAAQFFNYTFSAPGQSPVNFSLTDGFNPLASRRFTVAAGHRLLGVTGRRPRRGT